MHWFTVVGLAKTVRSDIHTLHIVYTVFLAGESQFIPCIYGVSSRDIIVYTVVVAETSLFIRCF
jgi:hypothetical protein